MERPSSDGLSSILGNMLVFTDIKFAYTGASRYALDGVSLTVEKGEHVVLLGHNGSGKSTLAKLSNGMLLPSKGTVLVDGISTASEDPAQLRLLRTTLGVVAQDPENQIVSSTVLDEVAFGPENLGLPREETARRVAEAVAAVGLTGKEGREPHTLSGGEKQRLVIAGILAMKPSYIVFDEPSSMLDANGRAEVMDVIGHLHTAGTGILHITHDLGECVSADRAVLLDEGRILFDGTPADLLAQPALLAERELSIPPLLTLAMRLGSAGVSLPTGALRPGLLAHAVVEHHERDASCHS